MQSRDARHVSLHDVDLQLRLREVLLHILDALPLYFVIPHGFVDFVKGYSKQNSVEEHYVGKVVDALVECGVVRNVLDDSESFLLYNDSVQSYFKPIADLSERTEEAVSS